MNLKGQSNLMLNIQIQLLRKTLFVTFLQLSQRTLLPLGSPQINLSYRFELFLSTCVVASSVQLEAIISIFFFMNSIKTTISFNYGRVSKIVVPQKQTFRSSFRKTGPQNLHDAQEISIVFKDLRKGSLLLVFIKIWQATLTMLCLGFSLISLMNILLFIWPSPSDFYALKEVHCCRDISSLEQTRMDRI